MAGRSLDVNTNTAPPTVEQIRQRAYEIYLERGSQPGKDVEHWLQAEAEFNERANNKNAQADTTVVIRR